MKKITYLLSIFAMCHWSQAQENFNAGIPANWTQWSGDNITWVWDSSLGTNSSGCAIADQGDNSDAGSAWLQTPFMNLSQLVNPELTVSGAVVQNNFGMPSLSLWYDIGSGWVEFTTNWTLTGSYDLAPPLDFANVNWNDLVFNLASVSSSTNIRFAFGSDFQNGGWVLIDNFEIIETGSSSGVDENELSNLIQAYPNPASDIITFDCTTLEKLTSVEIFSLDGKSVFKTTINDTKLTLDVSDFERGMYIVNFTGVSAIKAVPIILE